MSDKMRYRDVNVQFNKFKKHLNRIVYIFNIEFDKFDQLRSKVVNMTTYENLKRGRK